MRRLSLIVLTLLAILAVAGCSGAPATTDPYDLARKAMDAKWDTVQIDLAINAKDATSTIKIDPGAMRMVIDSKSGKALVHVAVPVSALGADAASLKALGVTGDSVDIDVVYDGAALYAKSPVLGNLLGSLLAQSGQMPSGDMTGWLRLGTKEDFASMGGSVASEAPTSSLDAAGLKKDLEANGVTLTFVGTESRNGVDANHVKAAVDITKLGEGSKALGQLGGTQLDQIKALAKTGTISLDFWTDRSSNKLVEADLHFVQTGTSAGTADFVVTLKAPDAGTSFDAPSSYTDLPVKSLLGSFLQMFGGSVPGLGAL